MIHNKIIAAGCALRLQFVLSARNKCPRHDAWMMTSTKRQMKRDLNNKFILFSFLYKLNNFLVPFTASHFFFLLLSFDFSIIVWRNTLWRYKLWQDEKNEVKKNMCFHSIKQNDILHSIARCITFIIIIIIIFSLTRSLTLPTVICMTRTVSHKYTYVCVCAMKTRSQHRPTIQWTW